MANMQPLTETATGDDGLRRYMLNIYSYMVFALLLTGGVAFAAIQSPTILNAMYVMADGAPIALRPLAWVIMFAPLALAIFMGFGLRSINTAVAQLVYWIYAALIGLSLSLVFMTFTGESIAIVFFITAGTFGAMSLYGYTTKRNLAGMGGFLSMALIGLIIAMLINLFLHSSALMFALSIAGVLIFVGLTAYDTQRLTALYFEGHGSVEDEGKLAIVGALTLYLDFVNLFLNLLNLFGTRRR